ncbi:MAG: TadE family protein [Anaerolineales bacterium]
MEPKRRNTNLFKRILYRVRRQPRGQSFVELMLVVMFLALLLAGVVEYGFMLNQYLHVLDGAREAARYAASSSTGPFIVNPDGSLETSPPPNGPGPIIDNMPFYYYTAAKAGSTMVPVELIPGLSPTSPDDIIISVFSVTTGNLPVRFPLADPQGWSLCKDYAGFVAFFNGMSLPVPTQLSDSSWNSCGTNARVSQFSSAEIQSRLNGSAPNTGVILVEIYYNYPQLLKLLSNNGFMGVTYSILPDPVPLYVYTIMPISAAEPTQVPTP